MTDQKKALLEMGWSEQELIDNKWQPRPWTEGTDRTWEQHFNDRDRLTCPKCKAVGTFKPRFNKDYRHPAITSASGVAMVAIMMVNGSIILIAVITVGVYALLTLGLPQRK